MNAVQFHMVPAAPEPAGGASRQPRVDDLLVRAHAQLRQARDLAEKARSLAQTTERQASTAESLFEESERLLRAARAMLDRVGALTTG